MHQQPFQLQPVAGDVAHHFLPGQAHVGQPRVGIGQPPRLVLARRKVEHLRRMFGRLAHQRQLAAGRRGERAPHGAFGRQQRAVAAAVHANRAQAGLHALVADIQQGAGVLPCHAPHVALQPGQQIALFAAAAAHHGQAAFARIVLVGGGNDGQVGTVRAPRQLAQLAGVVDAAQLAALQVDDAHAREHQGVVGQLARRDHQRKPVAGRAPVHRLHAALQFDPARRGVLVSQIRDPQTDRPPVLLVDLLAEALVAQRLEVGAGLFLRQQRRLAAVRRQAEPGNVGLQAGHALRLAPVQRDPVQPGGGLAVAAGQEGDAAAVREPFNGANGGLSGDEPAAVAVAVDHVQLGVRPAVGVHAGASGHGQHIGDLAAARAHRGAGDRAGLGDLLQAHALARLRMAQQRDEHDPQQQQTPTPHGVPPS